LYLGVASNSYFSSGEKNIVLIGAKFSDSRVYLNIVLVRNMVAATVFSKVGLN